jgi:hypothetical protein
MNHISYNTNIHGNVSYLKETKIPSFFFTKTEQDSKTGPVCGVGTSGEEDIRKGCRRVNMVEILCTHVCEWKKTC